MHPSLPAQRPGRRVSSGNFATTAGASGVIPRSGREPEPQGTQGGPGEAPPARGGARWRARGGGARGGSSARLGSPVEPRGACAGVHPAAGVRAPVGALGGARASSGACASGGGEQGAGNQAVRPPLPSRQRRRRGPCVQARSGEAEGEAGGGEEAARAGAPRCAQAGGTRRGRLRRRAGTRAQPKRSDVRVPLPLPSAKMAGGLEEGGWGAGLPGGEEGGSLSQPPAPGRGKEKGVLAQALSPYTPPPAPTHSSILPAVHSFIHPSTRAFIHKQVTTIYSACQGNPFHPIWRPCPKRSPSPALLYTPVPPRAAPHPTA